MWALCLHINHYTFFLKVTFAIMSDMNFCPPNPGSTVITSTMSTSSRYGKTTSTGVPGFRPIPAWKEKQVFTWDNRKLVNSIFYLILKQFTLGICPVPFHVWSYRLTGRLPTRINILVRILLQAAIEKLSFTMYQIVNRYIIIRVGDCWIGVSTMPWERLCGPLKTEKIYIFRFIYSF